MLSQESLLLAKKLWNYLQLRQIPEPSDCILVLGSHDLRVAKRAATLYMEGLAPLLICSGGLGNLTRDCWTVPEADQFASIAREMGVPAGHILIENQSTNTGENILFTRKMLQDKGLDPSRFLLVQKPYMERRSLATFARQWPGKYLRVTSPLIPFEDYPTPEIPMERVIQIMVGDLQRIRYYPALGFQIAQEIPSDVWQAYESLLALGYTKHLIKQPSAG
jgi:uncharacterized SAM-binding protein YcdF (DUF218 family)